MKIKICGLSTADTVAAAARAGADYVGFVFFPKSPRYVTVDQATALARATPEGIVKVGLVVTPDDGLLNDLAPVGLDMIQLAGAETPDRVAEVRRLTGLPVMKAVGVADQGDLPRIAAYEAVADQILLDAKPPRQGGLPGGNGLAFDWRLIAGRAWARPWMLAGGLNAGNVADAMRLTGADQVDLSSGVETAPGVKSAELIAEFCATARAPAL